MKKYPTILKNWFVYTAIITLMCGIVYITLQQNYRMNANDPQIQMAEDATNALNNGADPKSLNYSKQVIEISQSLSPFLVVYDPAGNIAAGNATLNGKALKIPQGVINYLKKNGKDAASWQPEPGVRQAMVGFSTTNKNYIVIAGRSLRVTEERINMLGEQVIFGWAISIAGMLIVALLQELMIKKQTAPTNPEDQ